jgi:hypothetical protein
MSGFFKLITDGSQFLGPAIMQVRAPGSTAGHRETSKAWAHVNRHFPQRGCPFLAVLRMSCCQLPTSRKQIPVPQHVSPVQELAAIT